MALSPTTPLILSLEFTLSKAERLANEAIRDLLSQFPDTNNPLFAYLRHQQAKLENQHTPQK